MAEADTRLTSAVIIHYIKGCVDSITEESPVYNAIKKKGTVKYNRKGRKVEWRARNERGTSVVNYSRDTELTFTPNDPTVQPVLEWAGQAASRTIAWRDVELCGGEQELWDLMESESDWLVSDNVESFEDDVYLASGNASNVSDVEGFAGFIAESGTYAGITLSGTAGTWNGNSITGTEFSTNPKNFLMQGCLEASRGALKKQGQITDIFCTRTQWQQIFDDTSDRFRGAMGTTSVELGASTFTFNGADITWDDSCPASTIYGINAKKIKLMTPHSGSLWDQNTDRKLSPNVFIITTHGIFQMITESPRYHFTIVSIT